MFDKIIVLLLSVIWIPILAIIAILVFLLDGRPVFFIQDRVGLGGKTFSLYKVRSMAVDAASSKGAFDAGCTLRVTRIGKVLRKTKLDELPQLFNVLKGDMSLVGPRPEVRKWVDVYPDLWEKIHSVRPGITDPASVIYRDEEVILAGSIDPEKDYRDKILPDKLTIYIDYIKNRSFYGDLKIILHTFKTLLS